MKHRIATLAAFLLATAGTALPSFADSFKVDPIHSMVVFQINHFHASNPFGIFHGVNGTITTGEDGAPTMDISVPVDKLDMGNDAWEKHIKSADFFNEKEFPNITFKSTAGKKISDDTFEVTGDLTLHGVTKSITVTITTSMGKGMKGETLEGFDCTFKIKRSDFGVKAFVPNVGDEVTLMVNIEGDKQ
jgi:polyisoprenoid-binding protein YceI